MNSKIAFSRYDGADEGDNGIRMSVDLLNARVSNLCVSELLGRLENFTDADRAMYPWATRFAMGFPLPAWQRPLVWSLEQKVKFIQSIWLGVDVGSYLINDHYQIVRENGGEIFREFSEILLDGQQRLTALEEYVTNVFPIPDATLADRFWCDLPKVERRRFGGSQFARATICSWDEGLLRLAYDLRAFGGTPHTEEQRALNNEDTEAGNAEVYRVAVEVIQEWQIANGRFLPSDKFNVAADLLTNLAKTHERRKDKRWLSDELGKALGNNFGR